MVNLFAIITMFYHKTCHKHNLLNELRLQNNEKPFCQEVVQIITIFVRKRTGAVKTTFSGKGLFSFCFIAIYRQKRGIHRFFFSLPRQPGYLCTIKT